MPTDRCMRYVRVAYAEIGHKEALFTRLRCKQWSCDYCARKNAATWQYWLIKRIPEIGGRWWLITLTANSKTRTEYASLMNLRDGIDALIKRAKRIWPSLEYVRVFEIHPTSEAVHAHFIMHGLSPFLKKRINRNKTVTFTPLSERKRHKGTWALRTWFKKAAQELKMGYMADAQEFEGDISRASFYVTKYLTKEQAKIKMPYLRHVQVSSGIGSPEFEKHYDWTPVSYITATTFSEPNTRVHDIDFDRYIDNDYWEHTGYYPDDSPFG